VTLDGNPELLRRCRGGCRAGVAHLANDAIHREVTGRDNNCDFIEDRQGCLSGRRAKRPPRLHLVSTRKVRRGEELLVSYSLGYWLGRERDPHVPAELRRWIAFHRRVTEALPGLFLWEYLGSFDDDRSLEYIARCSGGTKERSATKECSACKAGLKCRLRRAVVRWNGPDSLGFKYDDD
jgi:hypothetical protein